MNTDFTFVITSFIFLGVRDVNMVTWGTRCYLGRAGVQDVTYIYPGNLGHGMVTMLTGYYKQQIRVNHITRFLGYRYLVESGLYNVYN